jgi:hypothetical protein
VIEVRTIVKYTAEIITPADGNNSSVIEMLDTQYYVDIEDFDDGMTALREIVVDHFEEGVKDGS